jgi:hypothetical protein
MLLRQEQGRQSFLVDLMIQRENCGNESKTAEMECGNGKNEEDRSGLCL